LQHESFVFTLYPLSLHSLVHCCCKIFSIILFFILCHGIEFYSILFLSSHEQFNHLCKIHFSESLNMGNVASCVCSDTSLFIPLDWVTNSFFPNTSWCCYFCCICHCECWCHSLSKHTFPFHFIPWAELLSLSKNRTCMWMIDWENWGMYQFHFREVGRTGKSIAFFKKMKTILEKEFKCEFSHSKTFYLTLNCESLNWLQTSLCSKR
jgi:hypothetical protein